MAKNWWFKLDFKIWRTDSALRRCSLETRGFWLEVLCVMHETDTWKLEGSYEELGWLIGCAPEVVARCIVELKRTKTADVTLGNGGVTLVSRRLQREVKDREQTRLRVRKLRGNGDVTPVYEKTLNKSEVISKKKEVREEEKQSAKPDSADSKPKARKSRKKPDMDLLTRPDLPKDEYLVWLSAKPENEAVDVRKIFNDLLAYCKKQNETPTRKRLLNWVDRERKAVPMAGEVIQIEAAPKMTDAEKDAMFERQHYDRPLPKILVQ